MPYIEPGDRESVLADGALTPGELNYVITKMCDEYIDRHGMSYTRINDVIGVLECAKLEIYRRLAAPYEDKKIRENGDVYSPHLVTQP